MITLDTSGVFALLNQVDPYHRSAVAVLKANPGPYIIPVGSLGEAMYLIERRLPPVVGDAFLTDIEQGEFRLDCGEHDVGRIRTLIGRYRDLPLGYVDAAVIACAERHRKRVLTSDLRHFGTVAKEGTITLLPVDPTTNGHRT